jgi:hypothetical protein
MLEFNMVTEDWISPNASIPDSPTTPPPQNLTSTNAAAGVPTGVSATATAPAMTTGFETLIGSGIPRGSLVNPKLLERPNVYAGDEIGWRK